VKEKGFTGVTEFHLDEIALKKGHSNYETLIYTANGVVESMKGKKSLDLQVLLKTIPGLGQIQRVCMDMCSPFADAVRQAVPHAEIVLDRFHITKLLNKKLDKLRIKTTKKLSEPLQKEFSTIHFSLFKDERALTPEKKALVAKYLGFNTEMKDIYQHCQGFRRILFPETRLTQVEASQQLTEWCTQAKNTLGHFVKTIESWWMETLNACLYPLNNGRAEGFNNKIKLVKRMGFGFRNRETFKIRIQAVCNS
jgi:transposase